MKLKIEPNLVAGGTCLTGRYEFLGKTADADHEGRRASYAIPYSIGVVQEVIILDRSQEMRVLSRNSQLASQSLADIWRRELQLPLVTGTDTRPSMTDQIVFFGGWRRWGKFQEVDKGIKEDALWRATPRGVWELALRELFRGMEGQIPEAPRAVRRIVGTHETGGKSNKGGFKQGTSRDQMTVPDLYWYYAEGEDVIDRYRTWGRSLAPPVSLPRSTSYQDSWSEEAENRGSGIPVEVWKINSDSKKTLANEKLTGNRPLPTTHWNYHITWRQITEWCERIRRGGFARRNWLRVEFASGNWDADLEAARAARTGAVEGSPPVPNLMRYGPRTEVEKEPNTRRGARAEKTALCSRGRDSNTHDARSI